jgi:hypothetical protein
MGCRWIVGCKRSTAARGPSSCPCGAKPKMSDRTPRYGMILLDDGRPTLLRPRGSPVFFKSPDETMESAPVHAISCWMVYGGEDGWWPHYTQNGRLHPSPPPKDRVDTTLCPGFGGYAGGRFRGWSARGGAGSVPLGGTRAGASAAIRRSLA